jgi:hypothetical protein
MSKQNIGLVVTTKHKGVFFGYGPKPNGTVPSVIYLKSARMCVSWSSDIRGVTGLAAVGPSKNCRIGLSIPAVSLVDITSIMECSEDAVAAWEKGPWV